MEGRGSYALDAKGVALSYSLRSDASRRAVPCAARWAARRLAPWAGRRLGRCAGRSVARPYVFPSSDTSVCCDRRSACGGRAFRLHRVKLLRLLGGHQADLDEVQRADESIADPISVRARDRVPERDRPVMLDQQERGGRVIRYLPDDVPRLLLGEHLDAVLRRLGAGDGAGLEALVALDAEADEGADLGAELSGLLLGQVAASTTGTPMAPTRFGASRLTASFSSSRSPPARTRI
jgi:hypothetical protein